MPHNLFDSLKDLSLPSGRKGRYYSLAALETAGLGKTTRMPYSLRIVLESVLRNCDGKRVTEEHVRELASWKLTDVPAPFMTGEPDALGRPGQWRDSPSGRPSAR